MTEFEVGEVNGKRLVYCQLETPEEARTSDLPEGIYGYWMHGDERVIEPYSIIKRINQDALDGTLMPEKLTSSKAVADFHAKLARNQRAMIAEALDGQIREFRDRGLPQQVIDEIEAQKKMYSDLPFPGIDGLRPQNPE